MVERLQCTKAPWDETRLNKGFFRNRWITPSRIRTATVNEVVCGVLFKSIESLQAPYLGILWERYRKDYPACQEVPPLIPVVERYGEEGSAQVKPEFAEIPPLPRVWFVHASGNGIIQVQRDRFLHNWRKLQVSDSYPRYEQVFEMFAGHLSTFRKFLEENKLGIMEPLQYEMTYVNHINRIPRASKSLLPAGSSVPQAPQSIEVEPEVDVIAWREVFPVQPHRDPLFSEIVELRTQNLRRLKPRIHVDRRTIERNDA